MFWTVLSGLRNKIRFFGRPFRYLAAVYVHIYGTVNLFHF